MRLSFYVAGFGDWPKKKFSFPLLCKWKKETFLLFYLFILCLTLESQSDLFRSSTKGKCKCRSDFNYFLLLACPPSDVVVNMPIVISHLVFFHCMPIKTRIIQFRKRAREKIANAWMGRILVINFCIFLRAFGYIYAYCYYNFYFLFMGTDFFAKAHTMHNGGRVCAMMKILKLRSCMLSLLVHEPRGQNFWKFTFSGEHIAG